VRWFVIQVCTRMCTNFRNSGPFGGLAGGESPVGGEFEDVKLFADVVYFEFCLHEMPDPQRALAIPGPWPPMQSFLTIGPVPTGSIMLPRRRLCAAAQKQ
jgi:hypothetical protein